MTLRKVIFITKTELNYQSNLCFSHALEIFIPCLTISYSLTKCSHQWFSYRSKNLKNEFLRLLF